MKFCLDFWSIFGSELPVHTNSVNGEARSVLPVQTYRSVRGAQIQRSTKTLDKTSSSALGSQGKVVHQAEIYNFPRGTYPQGWTFIGWWTTQPQTPSWGRSHQHRSHTTQTQPPSLAEGTLEEASRKIDQNSRQNFILSHRFPRETCRSRRDLQLSLGNLPLRMNFCLDFWSIFQFLTSRQEFVTLRQGKSEICQLELTSS